ncbi:MAG: hypothetical protein COA62_04740 [Rhodobiaceae bacterium]|nr:MAG: hypothetical protein COA62_04740 [Rhodobiaceae bacterium]
MSETNKAQREYWNGATSKGWVAGQESLDRSLGGATDKLLERAAIAAGERIIDIGCGTGQTSLIASEKVGADGAVLGVDISETMLAHARDRASAESLNNVAFQVGDAQTDALMPDANLAMSRFGVMFFEDPTAAFANIKKHMVDGGRLCFACWQSPQLNDWVSLPGRIARQYVTDEKPGDPHAPGPFAFADETRVQRILEDAGWRDVVCSPAFFDMWWGKTPETAAESLMERGRLPALIADLSDETIEKIREELTAGLLPSEDGVSLEGAIWIVTARSG